MDKQNGRINKLKLNAKSFKSIAMQRCGNSLQDKTEMSLDRIAAALQQRYRCL